MVAIRGREYRKALSFVHDTLDAAHTDRIVLDGLAEVVGADLVDAYVIDARRGPLRVTHLVEISVPDRAPPADVWAVWRRNPMFLEWEACGPGIRGLSDFHDARSARKLLFYEYAMRPFGSRHILDVTFDRAPLTSGFVFDRCSGRDFSTRDRELLRLLAPHLRRLARNGHVRAQLTQREREVLALVREGMTNAEIAVSLSISPGTVRKHLENVCAKLGVRTRTAAVRRVFGATGRTDDVR